MLPELQELEIHSHYTSCHHDIDVSNGKKHAKKTRIVVDLKKENALYEENADGSEWWMIFS